MSASPQSSGFRAPRGPAIVASIGAGMLVTAIAGALMLFSPGGGQPTSTGTAPSASAPSAEAEAQVDTGRQVPVSREVPDNSAQAPRRKVVVPTVPPAPAPQPKAHPPQTRTASPTPTDDGDRDRRRCRDRDGDGWPDRCHHHDGGWNPDWDGRDLEGDQDWWRDHAGDGWMSDGGGWGN